MRRATTSPQRGHRSVMAVTLGALESSYSSTATAVTPQAWHRGNRAKASITMTPTAARTSPTAATMSAITAGWGRFATLV